MYNKIQIIKFNLCFGTGVPSSWGQVLKRAGIGTYHELYFIVCILLHFIECMC